MPQDTGDASTLPPAAFAGRRPAQKRSQVRVDALLNAADELLHDREAAEIGLYDVAHRAGVPPTSAYHFFPTKESVFVALAERYLQKMHAMLEAPIDLSKIERWPDWIADRNRRVVQFFNESLPTRKLLIGSAVGSEIKNLDFADIDSNASATYAAMNQIFIMPYLQDPTLKFTVLIGIYDGVWMSSYARHGYITPTYAREALEAGIAYLSTFLPQAIPLRNPDQPIDDEPPQPA